MKRNVLWVIQFIINEWFMMKLYSYVVGMFYKVENGWSIVLSLFLIIVFLLLGYALTEKFENS